MRTALVTGGAGFIGSHLAKRLLAQGWRVHIIDNLSTGFKSNIPSEALFTFLDLSEDGFANKLPDDKFDVVFHLAAQSSGEISFDNPMYDLKTNCLSTVMLLDWCLKKKIRRFVFTSSMSIYGDQDIQPVSESAVPNPKSFYGVGKLASEKYINIYSNMGLQTTSLRLFNVYGPGQNMENLRQGMVSIYMAYILKKQELMVKGSPDRYRDIIYIDDVINAYLACLDNDLTFGKSYNIGTGKKTTVQELVNSELKAFGYEPGQYPVKYGESTPGDTFGICAEVSAAKEDMGWEAKTPLYQGLRQMAEWAISRVKAP